VKQLTVVAWQFIGFGSISLGRLAVVGLSERRGRDADTQHPGPGGLRSELDFWRHSPANPSAPAVWMDPMATRGKKYRVVAMDQRLIGEEIIELAPNVEALRQWKGPEHLQAAIGRVTAFLDCHTPR
jgi:hypothetical protein